MELFLLQFKPPKSNILTVSLAITVIIKLMAINLQTPLFHVPLVQANGMVVHNVLLNQAHYNVKDVIMQIFLIPAVKLNLVFLATFT